MKANMLTVVKDALERGRAVPAFSVYDFTTAQAVVSASEEAARPVFLLVPSKVADDERGIRCIRALRTLADAATVEVCVQLDHATDLVLMQKAAAAGVDAVLADGSSAPLMDNVRLVQEARRLLGNEFVVEAELGALAGDEDVAVSNEATGMTDPDEVPRFLELSEADLLAVAVGNVHGRYQGEPQLDWARIDRIRKASEGAPLVLHGASGIPREDLSHAGSSGIGKVNFNTELRASVFSRLQDSLAAHAENGLNWVGLLSDWHESVEGFASGTHGVLGGEDGLPAQRVTE